MRPVLAFRFRVKLLGGAEQPTFRAQHVSGLSMTMQHDEVETTGGIKNLPSAATYADLVLQRAITEKADNDAFSTQKLINKLKVQRSDMGIYLLNPVGDITRNWCVFGAYATAWAMAQANASSNEVLLETITFQYERFEEM